MNGLGAFRLWLTAKNSNKLVEIIQILHNHFQAVAIIHMYESFLIISSLETQILKDNVMKYFCNIWFFLMWFLYYKKVQYISYILMWCHMSSSDWLKYQNNIWFNSTKTKLIFFSTKMALEKKNIFDDINPIPKLLKTTISKKKIDNKF